LAEIDGALAHQYPHPQMHRERWISLNGPWRFLFDDERRYRHPADIQQWPGRIEVPFPPESKASGIHDRDFHLCCWYERDFALKADGGRVILRFGAVDYSATVWVNGHLVATHDGGHTPFFADITDVLDPGGRQTVTLMATDDPHDLTSTSGGHTSTE
jgi:beta-galactosidase/beta-glucuronidase